MQLDARQPVADGGGERRQIGAEAVVAAHLHDRSGRGGWRHAEAVGRALDDQHRHRHRVELRKAAGGGLPPGARRRDEREREAEDAGCPDGRRGTASDPRAGGPSARDEPQAAQLVLREVPGDRDPGRVELVRRCRASPARDPVGLLDERDREARRARCGRRRRQVARTDAAARTVAEDERPSWFRRLGDVRGREAVRRLDLGPFRGCYALWVSSATWCRSAVALPVGRRRRSCSRFKRPSRIASSSRFAADVSDVLGAMFGSFRDSKQTSNDSLARATRVYDNSNAKRACVGGPPWAILASSKGCLHHIATSTTVDR